MDIKNKTEDFEKVIEHVSSDIAGVRTSRATPTLIENIQVNIYGSKMPVNQVASISCPEPKQLLVEPWDKNVLKDIEKAIETASLGLSVKNEGNFLRLSIPAMTEETRKENIKMLHEKLENGRVSLRNLRDKIKEEIITAERNKEIGEDEKYNLIEELDKTTREYTDKIGEIGKKKEEEITL